MEQPGWDHRGDCTEVGVWWWYGLVGVQTVDIYRRHRECLWINQNTGKQDGSQFPEAWQRRDIAAWKRSKARCQNHTPVSKEEKSENYDLSKFVAWLGSNTTPSGLYLKRKFEQRNPCSKEQLKKKVSVKRGEARLQKTLLSCVCEAEAVIWNKGGDAKYWQKIWISKMRAVLNLLHWLWAECLLFAIRTESGYNTSDWRLNRISL